MESGNNFERKIAVTFPVAGAAKPFAADAPPAHHRPHFFGR